jgi:hypothetical protein
MFLFIVEVFSCSSDILCRDLEILIAFFDQENNNFFSSVYFFQFFIIQSLHLDHLGPDSDLDPDPNPDLI